MSDDAKDELMNPEVVEQAEAIQPNSGDTPVETASVVMVEEEVIEAEVATAAAGEVDVAEAPEAAGPAVQEDSGWVEMTAHNAVPEEPVAEEAPEAPVAEVASTLPKTVELRPNQTLKGRLEAVLFITHRALSLHDIAEVVQAPVEDVELAMIELMGDFSFREGSALEIDDTDGYILQVREEYGDIVNKMMPLELSAAEIRTLSAIALKAPLLQSDLIEWRGASAYDHIANLLKHKLISKRRDGRSYQLNVTKHFYEYFKLMGDKKELNSLVQLIGKEEGEPKHRGEHPEDVVDEADGG